ncbi:hypothetical protein BJAS_P2611 [Bathymodiolus japonicus methanotrophic gill symbiont]|uniref:TlpA family protein disulfide reductase n=1 Tax=Bathymodiolus japonicus methanotrophic gill symbiont TaxID=113269 RepID=UPI001B78B868|nr:TlpA disulfide reductase family protein [Bathymodiolus japonicus methanotrophic gill symbiont]GFO72399.1 hypothetical protein BJAS_P2611 [Bathymodiolus japonicus methanotrophic gill symbiont]
MPKQFIALLFFSLLLISTLFAQQFNQQPQHAIPLPEFSLPDTAGVVHSISEWQGKIIVINLWATWCPPCLQEIPEFIQIQAEYADQNVQFIGIAIDEPELVNDYISFININYPILIATTEGGKLSQRLGNTMSAIPFTAIVNQQQEIM